MVVQLNNETHLRIPLSVFLFSSVVNADSALDATLAKNIDPNSQKLKLTLCTNQIIVDGRNGFGDVL